MVNPNNSYDQPHIGKCKHECQEQTLTAQGIKAKKLKLMGNINIDKALSEGVPQPRPPQ
jgi:hypothetical protein